MSKNDGRRGTFEEDLQSCIFCGRRGVAISTELALVIGLCDAAALLRAIDFAFVWQAWRLMPLMVTLCGRRGASCHAGVALVALGCLWWRPWSV